MSSDSARTQAAFDAAGRQPAGLVYTALTASAFFWGAGFAVGRFALREVSPLELLAGQALGAALVEVAWIVARGQVRALRLPAAILLPAVALGLLGQNILNGLTYLGLALTSATDAALIYGFSPIMIGVMAAMFLREPFSRRQRWGALVGFLGVAVVITQGNVESIRLRGTMLGNLLVLGGAVYWAAYAIVTRALARRIDPEVFTFYILVPAIILPLGWVLRTGQRLPWALHDTRTLLAVVLLGVGTGFLAMHFWNWGLSRIEASRAGVFSYLEPVFAGLIAIVFLGEHLTAPTAVGALLVFTGIFLTTRTRGL
jgi:drug/metabolite transporter (DMT)-like permease